MTFGPRPFEIHRIPSHRPSLVFRAYSLRFRNAAIREIHFVVNMRLVHILDGPDFDTGPGKIDVEKER